MKLDATDIRYLTSEDYRVLTAVEMGSKNHEIVPTSLIAQISKLKSGGINKILGGLAKRDLVARVQNAKYDGYRLTYGGYDYLAIRTMSKRDSIHSVGNQIGVGKESDIYVVANEEGEQRVLKLHRLGRVSFRAIKEKRDYMGKRKSASWMYMSRLAAQKEYAFMKVLHEHGFPVPTPIDQVRHCILMSLMDAYPLRQLTSHPNPGHLYSTLMDLIVRFAHSGLIHGDFNEFNILIDRETTEPYIIDFPQMVSTNHINAEYYFNRDVECIRAFFKKRFRYESLVWPKFTSTMKEVEGKEGTKDDEGFRLDIMVAASGFSSKEQRILEEYIDNQQEKVDGDDEEEDDEDDEEEDEEEVEDEKYEKEDTGSNNLDEGSADNNIESIAAAQSNSIIANITSQQDGKDTSQPQQSDEEPPTSEQDQAQELSDPNPDPASNDDEEERDNATVSNKPKPATAASDAVKTRVASELQKQQARQSKKYHSKKSTGSAGRSKGSKAKQDTRVRRSDWE